MTTLVPLDPTEVQTYSPAMREVAVSTYLERAKQWLATAVEMTGVTEIATAKAEIATAAEATKQLHLSKDIQSDAQEMVRRAEYALGKAIRKGQAEGTVAKRGDIGSGFDGSSRSSRGDYLVKPGALVPHTNERHALYTMADREPGEFDAALTEAKGEGDMSRANVVRKLRQRDENPPTGGTTREQRAGLIADLAAQGYTSRQMPAKVGVTEETVRQIARDFDIDIAADRSVSRKRVDWTDAVRQTVIGIENSVEFIDGQIDLAEVDFAEADEWLSSLTNSIRALNRFKQQIKEHSHV